jgi:hypothetical protein
MRAKQRSTLLGEDTKLGEGVMLHSKIMARELTKSCPNALPSPIEQKMAQFMDAFNERTHSIFPH